MIREIQTWSQDLQRFSSGTLTLHKKHFALVLSGILKIKELNSEQTHTWQLSNSCAAKAAVKFLIYLYIKMTFYWRVFMLVGKNRHKFCCHCSEGFIKTKFNHSLAVYHEFRTLTVRTFLNLRLNVSCFLLNSKFHHIFNAVFQFIAH